MRSSRGVRKNQRKYAKALVSQPGSELSGTYVSTKNKSGTVVFKPNNLMELYITSTKETKVVSYEVKDKTISFVLGMPLTFFMNLDGSLTLNGVETFVKKQIDELYLPVGLQRRYEETSSAGADGIGLALFERS